MSGSELYRMPGLKRLELEGMPELEGVPEVERVSQC